MASAPERPTPPNDFAARANGPLEHSDGVRHRRSKMMAECPPGSLMGEARRHAGEAYSSYCEFVAKGGTEIVRGDDDLADACSRMLRMPKNLRDRLDPVFVGLERLYDPNGVYRSWYEALSENYETRIMAKILSSGPDLEMRYRNCCRVVQETASEFAEFFDDLRECMDCVDRASGRWGQGDGYRDEWVI